jgi:hypothetical protein
MDKKLDLHHRSPLVPGLPVYLGNFENGREPVE